MALFDGTQIRFVALAAAMLPPIFAPPKTSLGIDAKAVQVLPPSVETPDVSTPHQFMTATRVVGALLA